MKKLLGLTELFEKIGGKTQTDESSNVDTSKSTDDNEVSKKNEKKLVDGIAHDWYLDVGTDIEAQK